MTLSAMDDNGKPIDWWFMYKVAGKSTTAKGAKGPTIAGKKITGAEYVYFDSSKPRNAKLELSAHTLDKSGALPNTLAQVYGAAAAANTHLGWFFYNDENPIDGKVNGSRGHTKGVLAFDLKSNSAFWLIQSTPKFPPKGKYAFPDTGMPNAQTLLCITLKDATVAQAIAKQMFVAQQPNVYLASKVPADLAKEPNDARVKLMQDQAATGSTPVHVVIPFLSKAGSKFMAIAKNRTWGLDFYNDLVGPALHENLEVETWEHDPTPPPADSDKVHKVVDMKAVDLGALGIDIAWPEPDDHAKLAISDKSEKSHFVCVGDINFTIAQRKRGGGTVAFQCEALWQSLFEILVPVDTSSNAAGTAAKPKPAAKPSSAAKKAKPAAKTAAKSKPAGSASRKTSTAKSR
jgi:deoxyribonuclease-2